MAECCIGHPIAEIADNPRYALLLPDLRMHGLFFGLALELEAEIKAAARDRQLSTLKQNADVQNSAPRDESGKSRQAIAQIAGVFGWGNGCNRMKNG